MQSRSTQETHAEICRLTLLEWDVSWNQRPSNESNTLVEESSAFQIIQGGNSTLISLIDKTKFTSLKGAEWFTLIVRENDWDHQFFVHLVHNSFSFNTGSLLDYIRNRGYSPSQPSFGVSRNVPPKAQTKQGIDDTAEMLVMMLSSSPFCKVRQVKTLYGNSQVISSQQTHNHIYLANYTFHILIRIQALKKKKLLLQLSAILIYERG